MSNKKFAKLVDTSSYDKIFSKLIDNESSVIVKDGSLIKGRVTKVDADVVIVDVGLKTEGRIALSEFKLIADSEDPKVGDEVEVFLEKIEGRRGKTILSKQKTIRDQAWKLLERAYEESKSVDGVIFSKTKGGFVVDLSGVIAFLPGGQVDMMPVKDTDALMNIIQKFKILKMDESQGNVIVSRKAVIEESRLGAKEEMLAKIQEGMVLQGKVKNITDYGAFIDLGSIDGLLHITDISWKRINHPSEVLSLGQELSVKVTKFYQETKRIHLGLRQLTKGPWEDIDSKYKVGDKVICKVINLNDYGAFVEVDDGVEGSIQSSEISWSKAEMNPKKQFIIGQEVEAIITTVDKENSKMFLSVKRLTSNPWEKFASKNKVGDIFKGRIRNIIDYAIFIDIGDGIDGMIHETDISWDGNGMELIKNYRKGDDIEAKITLLDSEKEKVFLSIKQLTEDPYAKHYEKYKVGDVIESKVSAIKNDYQVIVTIDDVIKGIIKRQDLSSDKSDQKVSSFKVGDSVTAKIVSIDRNQNAIFLSIKEYEIEQVEITKKRVGSTGSENNLGNIIEKALSEN